MKEELFAVNLIIRANAVALFGEQEYAVLTRLDKHNRWTAMVAGEEETARS